MSSRGFRYVGPADLRDLPHAHDAIDVAGAAALSEWLAGQDPRDRAAPFAYVVTIDGTLRVAPRRREHVACALGQDVFGAGEIEFDVDGEGVVVTVRDDDFVCAVCGDDLAPEWNLEQI